MAKYVVMVDIYPRVVSATNNSSKYIFGEYKTKTEAYRVKEQINFNNRMSVASIERR